MTAVRRHLLSILIAATAYGALTGAVPGDGAAPAAVLSSIQAMLPAFAERRAEATPVPPIAAQRRAASTGQSQAPRATEVVYALR